MSTTPQKPADEAAAPFPTSGHQAGDVPASPFPTSASQADKPGKPQADETQTQTDMNLDNKPPEELTEEELRLMADTMPGPSPGGD